MSVQRYHPFLVTLHWLIAALLLFTLLMGTFVLDGMPSDDPDKIIALKGHMIAGLGLLALMIIRLIVRIKTDKPAPVKTGNAFLDKLAKSVHHGFYLFVILMALSGFATAIMAGLPGIVFGGSGEPLPKDFFEFPPRIGHAVIAKILMLLVALHVAGALFHQFRLKDKLISRMWFGKR